MQGGVLLAFIIGVVLIINFFVKKQFLKRIPLSKGMLLIVGLGLVGYAAVQTGYWGWGGELSGVPGVPVTPTVTPGVLFETEGSESDANLNYDYPSGTFSCQFYENVDSGAITDSANSAITSVTFTITVFRVDLLTVDNATAKVWATVPTYYGKNENASIQYWPVDKDSSSEKFEVAFTPAGVSARDEYNFFTVGQGGSKAITVVADLYGTGLAQLDNMDSKDVKIYVTGIDSPFTLRFTKIGETSD